MEGNYFEMTFSDFDTKPVLNERLIGFYEECFKKGYLCDRNG